MRTTIQEDLAESRLFILEHQDQERRRLYHLDPGIGTEHMVPLTEHFRRILVALGQPFLRNSFRLWRKPGLTHVDGKGPTPDSSQVRLAAGGPRYAARRHRHSRRLQRVLMTLSRSAQLPSEIQTDVEL